MTTSPPAVTFRGVSKSFGATVALRDVTLTVSAGEVHALVGENGAGKSTLGKVLAGIVSPDSGEILLAGRSEALGSPRQALAAGVTMIAQELSLVPGLSVADNVFLGIEPHTGPWVRRGEIRKAFESLVRESGIDVPDAAQVGNLRIGDQQKVEILRALARNARVIVMDEPTARLSRDETAVLLKTVRALAAAGTTIIFVSHFLDEVLQVADSVTIMRDAAVVRSGPAKSETRATLIEGMTGRPLDAMFPARRPPTPGASTVLEVTGLSRKGVFEDISFSVRQGEIVVLSGLVGSGRSEVVQAVYGSARATSGSMDLNGVAYRPRSVRDALDAGLALIPESRKDLGLVLDRSVADNVTLPYLRDVELLGLISLRREEALATDRMSTVGVKAASPRIEVATLSGGNQQKVLFARSLVRTPALLLADEPTRGVDVGAKRSIYDLITSLASEGMGVLVVSSEIEEVMGLAHRILVMHQGRLVAEFRGEDADEASVIAAAFGPVGATA
jgi:simple sugar transport system ATP-binding protein/ribose transport system ATP-binding protein